MKFVIWGCGYRGKNILKFLGKDKVSAFIDSSEKLIGNECNGVKVISIDDYINEHNSDIIIVSPARQSEIIKKLINNNIDYFSADTLPPEIAELIVDSFPEAIENKIKGNETVYLYGFNAYSVIMLDHIKGMGYNVKIIPSGSDTDSLMCKVSENYPECFGSIENITNEKIFLTSKKYIDDKALANKKAENFYDFLTDIKEYYNPEIEKLKNTCKGKRCFIVATGPSLKIADLDKLAENNEICISMNGIYKLYTSTKWRPGYYMVVDRMAFDEWKEDLLKHENSVENMIIPFHCLQGEKYEGITSCQASIIHESISPGFSTDCSKGIYGGATVTYGCIQLAFYLGCTEIYLLGVDFNYTTDSKNNHFIGSYGKFTEKEFLKSQNDNDIDLRKMKLCYETAKKKAEGSGIKIYNASRQTKLDTFERVDFDSLF